MIKFPKYDAVVSPVISFGSFLLELLVFLTGLMVCSSKKM